MPHDCRDCMNEVWWPNFIQGPYFVAKPFRLLRSLIFDMASIWNCLTETPLLLAYRFITQLISHFRFPLTKPIPSFTGHPLSVPLQFPYIITSSLIFTSIHTPFSSGHHTLPNLQASYSFFITTPPCDLPFLTHSWTFLNLIHTRHHRVTLSKFFTFLQSIIQHFRLTRDLSSPTLTKTLYNLPTRPVAKSRLGNMWLLTSRQHTFTTMRHDLFPQQLRGWAI